MVKDKTGLPPVTKFYNHLNRIKVTCISAPRLNHLETYLPEFVHATWADTPEDFGTNETSYDTVVKTFKGEYLPTALETIQVTFRVEGLDLIDVTHLIRHRTLSFSAQCTADRDLREDDCLVKPSILNSKYYDQYMNIVKQAKELYAQMVDEREVSILDARTILPRSLSNFYYVSGNVKDILAFIRTRLDEQIQPQSDNVVAMHMFLELARQYPFIRKMVTIGGVDKFYCDTVNSGTNSNIYMPKPENVPFIKTTAKFQYPPRDTMRGSETYLEIKERIKQWLDII